MTTTAEDIAKAMRKLELFPRQRAKRQHYAERWCTARFGDVQDLQLLCRFAARESLDSVESQLVRWIDGDPAIMRESIQKAREHRRPETVMQDDQERSDNAEAEWLDISLDALADWKWRRSLAEWVEGGWTVEATAQNNGTTVEKVEAAIKEFSSPKAQEAEDQGT